MRAAFAALALWCGGVLWAPPALAHAVLDHRLICEPGTRSPSAVVAEVLQQTPVTG